MFLVLIGAALQDWDEDDWKYIDYSRVFYCFDNLEKDLIFDGACWVIDVKVDHPKFDLTSISFFSALDMEVWSSFSQLDPDRKVKLN